MHPEAASSLAIEARQVKQNSIVNCHWIGLGNAMMKSYDTVHVGFRMSKICLAVVGRDVRKNRIWVSSSSSLEVLQVASLDCDSAWGKSPTVNSQPNLASGIMIMDSVISVG